MYSKYVKFINFNGGRLQYGREPGGFLVFSLLPGIGNAVFVSVDVDHRHINVCIRLIIFAGGLNHKIISTAKFSQSTVALLHLSEHFSYLNTHLNTPWHVRKGDFLLYCL